MSTAHQDLINIIISYQVDITSSLSSSAASFPHPETIAFLFLPNILVGVSQELLQKMCAAFYLTEYEDKFRVLKLNPA